MYLLRLVICTWFECCTVLFTGRKVAPILSYRPTHLASHQHARTHARMRTETLHILYYENRQNACHQTAAVISFRHEVPFNPNHSTECFYFPYETLNLCVTVFWCFCCGFMGRCLLRLIPRHPAVVTGAVYTQPPALISWYATPSIGLTPCRSVAPGGFRLHPPNQ